MPKHPYHSSYFRTAYSCILICLVMTVGTIGVHFIEHMPWSDAFYFMSMIATAQGANYEPQTVLGKVFIAAMAFVSVGAVVAALGFLFGPFLGKVFLVGEHTFEEEIKSVKHKRD